MAGKVVVRRQRTQKRATLGSAKRKAKYTEAEKKAYAFGQVYGAGKSGKRVELSTSKERVSFRKGMKRTAGK